MQPKRKKNQSHVSYAIFGLKWVKNHMDMDESERKQTALKVYETINIIKKILS